MFECAYSSKKETVLESIAPRCLFKPLCYVTNHLTMHGTMNASIAAMKLPPPLPRWKKRPSPQAAHNRHESVRTQPFNLSPWAASFRQS